ncbi:MAG: hypothetical protein MUF05_07560 [Candidatus Omnitrophica bacterium]|jgi:hypothetical protein|nr:hypothetical protein [Candidatus Omnitrophota bacterium]
MADKSGLTPEKKLLSIIEGEKKPDASVAPAAASAAPTSSAQVSPVNPASPQSPAPAAVSSVRPAPVSPTIRSAAVKQIPRSQSPSIFSGIKDLPSLFGKVQDGFSVATSSLLEPQTVNRVLIAVAMGVVFYGCFYLWGYKSSANNKIIVPFDEQRKLLAREMANMGNPVTFTEEYLKEVISRIRGRDLFKPLAKEQKMEANSDAASIKEMEINKTLKLVGVSIGENPVDSYAMIEDLTNKVTYFLRANDNVHNTTVAQIQNDKVILDFQGRKIELR